MGDGLAGNKPSAGQSPGPNERKAASDLDIKTNRFLIVALSTTTFAQTPVSTSSWLNGKRTA
jgi:hypothetical protein